jgi:hypothetical protein
MDANTSSLLELFDPRRQFEVPLFQRKYVWTRAEQWEPLWEDISRQLRNAFAGETGGPVHFLGALVLDQKQVPAMHIERRQVIDGQQRLTTFQIFLAALRDLCKESNCPEMAAEFGKCTLNTGRMANPARDCFKVLPTQADQECFADIMTLGSLAAVRARYPEQRRPRRRRADPRPPIVEAYLYFDAVLRDFFLGSDGEDPLRADLSLDERFDLAFRTLKGALVVVVIDLDRDDDPQVIFETLNARGQPLFPIDLLRNYVFLRLGHQGGDTNDLYETHWSGFDTRYWSEVVTQGRLSRPRSDLFLQHFLASQTSREVPAKHLYVEYRHWINRARPFASVVDELACIAAHREHFKRVLSPVSDDAVGPLALFMEDYDIRTAYPLVLHLLSLGLEPDDWRRVSATLESYLLRRAFLGWSTAAYNRVFLTLLRNVRGTRREELVGSIERELAALTGTSAAWPTDDQFEGAWLNDDAYNRLQAAKLVHVLRRLSDTYRSSRTETVQITSLPTIEHLMPQKWHAHWPLPDGTFVDDSGAEESTRATQASARNRVLQTIGNLTLLTQSLNSSISNQAWEQKRPAVLGASMLPLNLQLQEFPTWDESAIERRGRALFERALRVWPRPQPA